MIFVVFLLHTLDVVIVTDRVTYVIMYTSTDYYNTLLVIPLKLSVFKYLTIITTLEDQPFSKLDTFGFNFSTPELTTNIIF